MYTTWEIETLNLWFTQMVSQEGLGGQNILLVFVPNQKYCRRVHEMFTIKALSWSPIEFQIPLIFNFNVILP